jgi:hypothetical protein
MKKQARNHSWNVVRANRVKQQSRKVAAEYLTKSKKKGVKNRYIIKLLSDKYSVDERTIYNYLKHRNIKLRQTGNAGVQPGT